MAYSSVVSIVLSPSGPSSALDTSAVPLHNVRQLRPRGALSDVWIDEEQRLQLS